LVESYEIDLAKVLEEIFTKDYSVILLIEEEEEEYS